MKTESFVVSPKTRAAALNVLGVSVTVLATNAQTQGYEITLQSGDEGMGPPPHHHRWDESFYVLKGSVEINVEGKVQLCTPGTLVHLPAGTVHGYRFGAGGAEMFEMTGSGSTATQMFTDVDREVPPGPPDLARLMPVFEHHGVTLVMGEAA